MSNHKLVEEKKAILEELENQRFEWKGDSEGFPEASSGGIEEAAVGLLDYQHPWFLKKGYNKSRSVAVIDGLGTGFLISRNLLMTNRHVLRTGEWAEGQTIRFGYEYKDKNSQTAEVGKTYSMNPNKFFHNNKEGGHCLTDC